VAECTQKVFFHENKSGLLGTERTIHSDRVGSDRVCENRQGTEKLRDKIFTLKVNELTGFFVSAESPIARLRKQGNIQFCKKCIHAEAYVKTKYLLHD